MFTKVMKNLSFAKKALPKKHFKWLLKVLDSPFQQLLLHEHFSLFIKEQCNKVEEIIVELSEGARGYNEDSKEFVKD